MIRRLLMTIVFFIVLIGTAYAVPITYYFGGTLDDALGTLPIGTQFDGSFSYDNPEAVYSSRTGKLYYYKYDGFSITFNTTTFSNYALGNPLYIYDNQAMNYNGVPLPPVDVINISMALQDSQILGGLSLRSFRLVLKDLSCTAISDNSPPGPNLVLDDFTSTAFYITTDQVEYRVIETLDYFSTTPPVPVPEPATMLLLGTGLIGIAGVMRKKIRVGTIL